MRRRHDPFLKRLYRAGTRDALSLFLPDLAAPIDWNHWRWIDKEIVIPGRRPRGVVADLVGETRDREGRYLKVLVHPELQMTPDAAMDWRVFEYNAGLLLREGNPENRVLTVVFYHCSGTGGIRECRFDMDYYGTSLHHVTYWSVGLGELAAEEYAEGDNPMGWALTSWMRQPSAQRVELRVRVVEKILRFVREAPYQELLFDAVQTYYRLSRTEREAEERLLASREYGEVGEMAQTVLERRESRGRRAGRQEALQEALVAIVRKRFPAVAAEYEARIRQERDPEGLKVMIDRALTVASPEEIWPAPGP